MEGFHPLRNRRSERQAATLRDRLPKGRPRGNGLPLLAFGLAIAVALGSAGAAPAPTNAPTRVKVSGFGFLENREMVRLLRNFQPDGNLPVVIDRTFVEDAALVLLARAHDEGYLHASLGGEFIRTDGSRLHVAWTNALEIMLPRDFAAHEANFVLQGGVRFYYRSVAFKGLKAFTRREATSYFVNASSARRG